MKSLGSIALAAALLTLLPVAAPDAQAGVRTVAAPGGVTVIHFAPGATSATVAGRVRGYAMARYRLRVRAGQNLVVTLHTPHPSLSFNVVTPSGQMDFEGSMTDANRAVMDLRESGDYVIQVYFMRNEARRGAAANYRLTVEVTD